MMAITHPEVSFYDFFYCYTSALKEYSKLLDELESLNDNSDHKKREKI
jgi:hypothetical protein